MQLISMFTEGLWGEYLPLFFLNLIFVILFLIPKFDRTMDTVTHRTRTAWYYFFCIAILGHVWIVIGLTGIGVDELKQICITNEIAEKWYNGDNLKCREEMRIVLIITLFINMLFQLYYAYILKTYAEERKRFEDPNMSHSHALY